MKLTWNSMMMIASLAVLGGAMAEAQATGLQSCGFHSANGAYAFRNAGTGPKPDKTGTASGLFVGVMVLDGAGGGSLSNTGSIEGNIIHDSRPKITYTVNRDCTGTMTVAVPEGATHWDIVIADNGKKILGIVTDPGLVFSMEATKQ